MNAEYQTIYDNFHPKLITIQNWEHFASAFFRTGFFICGEVHGIKENADIIYTYCKKLNIKRLAIECSPSIKNFIETLISEKTDFSLIDLDVFNASPLSVEMAKTIATLFHEKILNNVSYIDSYTSSLNSDLNEESPQIRESLLAEAIINLPKDEPTLCLMGRWHTSKTPIDLQDMTHYSALYRLQKQLKTDILYIENTYQSGQLYNDGKIITLPFQKSAQGTFSILKKTATDFELNVPLATKIDIPKKS